MQISSTNFQYSTSAINSASPVPGDTANISAKQQLSNLKLESALGQAMSLSLTYSRDPTSMIAQQPDHAVPTNGPEFSKYIDPRGPTASQGPVINRPNPRLDNDEAEYSFGPNTPIIAICYGGTSLPGNRPALGLLDEGSPAISRQQLDQMSKDTQMLDKLMAALHK